MVPADRRLINVERATGKPSICSNPRRILSYDTPQIIFWNAAKASSLGRCFRNQVLVAAA